MNDLNDFRSGFVAIIGKPNVGKSTLMNKLIGEKLSITSSKPQTTRLSIKGIYNDPVTQIIFWDTPGFLKPRYELHKRMLHQFSDALNDADVILFISEKNNFPTDYDYEILELLKVVKRPKVAIINKSDLKSDKSVDLITSRIAPDFEKVIFTSALNSINLDQIIPSIINFLPLNPPFYETDQLSDLPMRFFAQESIREAVFRQFAQEIPYASAVVIDKYEELQDRVVIYATIWVERDSQKPIIIGKNGAGLKKIREYAQPQIVVLINQPVELHLWVKVKNNWRSSKSALKEIGFRD
jgi:GTPase